MILNEITNIFYSEGFKRYHHVFFTDLCEITGRILTALVSSKATTFLLNAHSSKAEINRGCAVLR